MDSVFNDIVHLPICDRSVFEDNNMRPLGFQFNKVRSEITEFGRADFTEGYSEGDQIISADDKVLLYCFLHMRGHFWSTYANDLPLRTVPVVMLQF
ncbi:hypothetical protein Pan241w_55620 [Gimesia alba]|uniref:Uncharacterized protein n=1 Tax=Gimesia alba TaxID=2527973 RepID=A0A517RNN8_9PLAN|nr:hypothetical protein Pan241w_55620 [Gimesia alba]